MGRSSGRWLPSAEGRGRSAARTEQVAGVFVLGSLRWTEGREEVKHKSPIIEGQPATKTPIITKTPIVVDVFGELKQLP